MRYLWVLAVLGFALAQQTSDKKGAPPAKPEKKEEQPLFLNKVGYKSSKEKKETQTMAYNGLDPATGKVQSQLHGTQPAATDVERVKKMADAKPSELQLLAFIRQGELKSL